MLLRTRILPLLSLSAVALSCDRSTRPPEVVAEYALVSVAGAPLPAPLFAGATTIVVADTVRLREGGSGERIWVWRDARAVATSRERNELTWRAAGDTLEVDFPCRGNALALCVAPPYFGGRIMPGMQWALERSAIYALPVAFDRVGMR